jgi:hypothetical protein
MILVIMGTSDNSKHHVFNSNNSNNKSIDLVFPDFEIPITVGSIIIKRYA